MYYIFLNDKIKTGGGGEFFDNYVIGLAFNHHLFL